MNTASSLDPFKVLGVAADASEAEIRARYLELVKQFPPERDPEKFRQVQSAFEAAKDPLVIARRLLTPPSEEAPPRWSDVLEEQKRIPPPLSPVLLLSLGNRDDAARQSDNAEDISNSPDRPAESDPNQKQYVTEQPHK